MLTEEATYHDRTLATTSARVHFGLPVCGDVVSNPLLGPFLFGGGGAAVDAYHTQVRADRTDVPGLEIVYASSARDLPTDYYLSDRTVQDHFDLASRIYDTATQNQLGGGGARLTILSSAPEHVGLGSKTSLAMATAYALGNLLLADRDGDGYIVPLSHAAVRHLSGRGGTSRVGVLACEYGGIVFEDGHRVVEGEAPVYLPSARRTPRDEPIISKNVILPDDYRIALFMDPETPRISGQEEMERFRALMPFSYLEVLEAIAVEAKTIRPAFDLLDMQLLSRGLRFFSNLVLKREEVRRQTDRTKSLLSNCWDNGYAAGVSSWGPASFVIDRKDSEAIEHTSEIAQALGLLSLGTHKFNNAEARVEQRLGWEDVLADMIHNYETARGQHQDFVHRTRY